ncbi:MAG: chromosomal replication initiator protein DnaA [Chitinivibrionales bacterium]|nr:chromosomal replication initiator protein DnaA [Chitinivibrionales bacterium]
MPALFYLLSMHKQTWNQILAQISFSVDQLQFDTWFKQLSPVDNASSNVLTLQTHNKFISDFLEQNYKSLILKCAQSISADIEDIHFRFGNGAHPTVNKNLTDTRALSPDFIKRHTETSNQYKEIPASRLNKRFIFDSFVVGSGNEFARSAATAVAEAPGKTKFNPLLIYGGVGLGKTHLLQAIGNFIHSLDQGFTVSYLTSEEFYLEFIDAIKNNVAKKFSQKYRTSDVLLVDDVQFFSGKESTQEEFFYVFNTLYQNGKQIVLTSDLPPSSLKGLQDRLISRFQWGLCVDIQPPDLETRVAILKRKAEEDNLNIPENVLYFIAENISSNIRELEGVIIRLLAYASITKSDITIDLVQSLLKKTMDKGKSKISIDEIIEKVSDYYKVPQNHVREKNRRKEVALCRQIAMYITKSITNYSLKTIGLNFGGRDHSTVIHAIQQVEKLKDKDESILQDVNYIISMFKD